MTFCQHRTDVAPTVLQPTGQARPIPTVEATALTVAAFQRDYMHTNTPVLIRGCSERICARLTLCRQAIDQ